MTQMKVKALAPWFGSKRNLAPEIVAEFGKHAAYWEPFCGSMAVLLAKPQCPMETVNDLNGDLVNLARTIQHEQHGPRLYRRLRRAVMSSELFLESAEVVRRDPFEPTPERAYHYFVFCWMGRNGDQGTRKVGYSFCKRFTKNGGHAATRFAGVVDSIPAFRRRLRNLTILREDGFALLARVEDSPGVVVYADPPYLVKGAQYVHDFDDQPFLLFADGRIAPADHAFVTEPGEAAPNPITAHEALAITLRRFEHTRVVVSYYDHPLLDELYPGWTKRRLKATKAMVSSGRRDQRGAVEAPEVLLINGPSFVEVPEGRLF